MRDIVDRRGINAFDPPDVSDRRLERERMSNRVSEYCRPEERVDPLLRPTDLRLQLEPRRPNTVSGPEQLRVKQLLLRSSTMCGGYRQAGAVVHLTPFKEPMKNKVLESPNLVRADVWMRALIGFLGKQGRGDLPLRPAFAKIIEERRIIAAMMISAVYLRVEQGTRRQPGRNAALQEVRQALRSRSAFRQIAAAVIGVGRKQCEQDLEFVRAEFPHPSGASVTNSRVRFQ